VATTLARAALGAAVLLGGLATAQAKTDRARLRAGDRPPEFTLKTLDGRERVLADLRGEARDRIVAVVFWSPTCPWSRAHEAELSSLAREMAARSVVVAAIVPHRPENSDGKRTDAPRDLDRYRKERKLAFDLYVDPDQRAARAFGAQTTPDVFVIGADGRVAYTGAATDLANPAKPEFTRAFLREALEALAAGKPAPLSATSNRGSGIRRSR
jgi:peroxiredoxin